MYLTYDEYYDFGGRMEEEEFDRVNFKVSKYIDLVTHCRVKDEVPVREAVKRCAYELTVLLARQEAEEASAAAGVSSVNNDGVSVTYAGTAERNRATETARANIVMLYLADEIAKGVPLLYRGVEHDSVR